MNEPDPLPHTDEGERAILSCILLDGPLSLAKAIDGKIDENCFYHPAHRKVWKSIQWLHRHNQPLELAVLTEELKKRNLLEEVGGIQGLIACTKSQPTTAELGYWIEEVRKCYVMREVYAASKRMQERVMARSGNVPDFVQEMNSLLTLHHASSKHTTLAEAANEAASTVELIEQGKYKQEDLGHSWPWADWTKTFGLARPGELIILSARPSIGKSSASRQIAWHWAQDGQVLLFSREMNAKAIAPLIAQVNTGISWREVVNGHARAEELAGIKQELRKLEKFKNLTVYDADRTLAHIVTRVKAVSQTQPIKAIVIDYLQRYDPQQERGETRDVALGRFTMAMKDLAVDLSIPVLLLAQVGRAVERENREPRMSDLRECLSVKDSLIFTSQGVWYNTTSPMSTISLNSYGEVCSCDSRNAKREDAPKMMKITLQSGRFVTCTPNHAIRTDRGWLKASEIKDESIACVRQIPAPRNTEHYSFAKWLGWMLGNGSMTGLGGPSFICSCEDVAKSFCETNKALWGFDPKPHKHWSKSVYQYDINNSTVRTPEGNPVKNWLKQHDLWGYKAHEKTLPQWFCETADDLSLAQLIAGMWETDGSVILKPRPQLSYSTTSPMLAWQVVWALNRLGVFANFEDGYLSAKANHPCYKVSIRTKEEITNFKKRIKLIGRKGRRLDSIPFSNPSNTAGSRLSKTIGEAVDSFRILHGLTHAQMGYRYQGKRISQRDLKAINDKIKELGYSCPKFDELTNPEIFWDKIRRIEYVPGGPVFDRVVPEHHNFVANGIIVHNSGNIEQDADKIIFLHAPEHRPDGSPQNLTDNDLRYVYVDCIQAKGRNDGMGRAALMFERRITKFLPYTPEP